VQAEFPPVDHLFTTVDGSCLVYTTLTGVFRRCSSTGYGTADEAIGPGHALEAPVVDATSIYWRTQQSPAATTIFAACKM
jgi:hypothetical protein